LIMTDLWTSRWTPPQNKIRSLRLKNTKTLTKKTSLFSLCSTTVHSISCVLLNSWIRLVIMKNPSFIHFLPRTPKTFLANKRTTSYGKFKICRTKFLLSRVKRRVMIQALLKMKTLRIATKGTRVLA
jgi:hypothetical protein